MYSSLLDFKKTIKLKKLLWTVGYFLVSFLLFLLVHINLEGFFGSDAFYHAAHSNYYQDTFYYTQDWIKLHFFSTQSLDPYFLFHKGGGIFISWFGKELGFKIFGSLLSALVIASFYVLLELFRVKHSHYWTFIFTLGSSHFLMRLFLIRSYLLAIPLILFSYYFIKEEKWIWLILISSFYALYYELSLFLILIAFAFTVSSYINNKKIRLKPVLYCLLGIIIGITLHPSSINYLRQFYVHVPKIFYLKLIGVELPTGNEINLRGFTELLKKNYLSLIIYIVSTAVFLGGYYKQKLKKYLPLFLITLGWFLLILFIPRAVEYWHPFSILFAAIILSQIEIPEQAVQKLKRKVYKANLLKSLSYLLLAILLIVNGFLVTRQIITKTDPKELNHYQQTAEFIKEKSTNKELVFFTNWSYFPRLFYYNQKNKYITGFDPVFAYNYDKEKYWLWLNISNYALPCSQEKLCFRKGMKNYPEDLKSAFKELKVKYIILENEEDKLLIKALTEIKPFKKIHENEKFSVFSF